MNTKTLRMLQMEISGAHTVLRFFQASSGFHFGSPLNDYCLVRFAPIFSVRVPPTREKVVHYTILQDTYTI